MQDVIYRCDVCVKERGEANGWFVVSTTRNTRFEVLSWFEGEEEGAIESWEHICGQECLHKRLNQWLETTTTYGGSNGSNSSEG